MAGNTAQVSVNGADWTAIASSCTGAIVQLVQDGPILIHVAAAKPDAGVNVGVILWRDDDGITTLPLTGLISGTDIVYAKCKKDETETVSVITTAPAA